MDFRISLAALFFAVYFLFLFFPRLFGIKRIIENKIAWNVFAGSILNAFFLCISFWDEYLMFGPGIIFSMAVAGGLRKKNYFLIVLFVFLSTVLYYSMVALSLVNGYWGPNFVNMIFASLLGAVAEVLLFGIFFQSFSYFGVKEGVLVIITGLFSFMIIQDSLGFWILNFTLWFNGVGLALNSIHKKTLVKN